MTKRVKKAVVCLVAEGLVFVACAYADNPYQPIVTRNVFSLNPPQVGGGETDANPPPKITPTGIMTIFGMRQALFTVDGVSKPGQPGKNESYILSEGQRQDDIEVTHIDEKNGVVTFNNHGMVQEIPLVKAPAIAASVTPASVAINSRPVVPFNNNSGGNSTRFGSSRFNRNNDTSSSLRSVPTRGTMSSEEQMIMIAAQHAKAQQEGDPTAPIYPPTPLDNDAGVTPNTSSPGQGIPMPPAPGGGPPMPGR